MTFARLAIAVSLPQLFDYKAENITAADLGRCLTVPFAIGSKTGVAEGEQSCKSRQNRHSQYSNNIHTAGNNNTFIK